MEEGLVPVGLFDKFLGRDEYKPQYGQQPAYGSPAYGSPAGAPQAPRPGAERGSDVQGDQAAIERYRYLLRTAPPERLEQAHAEAFAQLSPDQRKMVLSQLSAEVPPAERATSDDPQALARMATRAEMRRPGTLERSFGGWGGGIGMGGLIAGGLLSSVAGAFIGTAIADSLFDGGNDFQEGYEAAADDFSQNDGWNDSQSGQETAGDFGGGDDFGDFDGGDF